MEVNWVGTLQEPLEAQVQEREHQTIHTLQRREIADLQKVLGKLGRQRRGVVNGLESFSLNSAKSYIGKNVNLHLKDGAVIVNVHLTKISKRELGKGKLLEYVPYGNTRAARIPLRNVAWAELLNFEVFESAG